MTLLRLIIKTSVVKNLKTYLTRIFVNKLWIGTNSTDHIYTYTWTGSV